LDVLVVAAAADDDGDDGHDAAAVVVVDVQGCFDTSKSVVDGKNDSRMQQHCSPCERPTRKD